MEQVEELWFEGGTVVLVAGNVEFYIYKDLLADHSSMLKDTFPFPQPPTWAPDVPGLICPTLWRISGKAADVSA